MNGVPETLCNKMIRNFSKIPVSGALVSQEAKPTVSANANNSFFILLVLGYPEDTQSLKLQ